MVLFWLASPAAAVEVITDPAAFLDAIAPGSYLETFDEIDEFPEAPIELASGGFAYRIDLTESAFFNFFDPADASDLWLSTDSALASIVLTFTSGNVTAIGGFFFTALIDGTPTVGDVLIQTDQGSPVRLTPMLADPSNTFLGFVSDTPFASLTLTATQEAPDGSPQWPVANDVVVGMVVPEPSGHSGLLAAAVALAWLRRRRGGAERTVSPRLLSSPRGRTREKA